VGPEEASYEVIPSAEFTTLRVKALPPVLMVAMGQFNFVLATTGYLTWLATFSQVDVEEGIILIRVVSAQPHKQVAFRTKGPSPFVHGARPIRNHFVGLARLLAKSTIEIAFVARARPNNAVTVTFVRTFTRAVCVPAVPALPVCAVFASCVRARAFAQSILRIARTTTA